MPSQQTHIHVFVGEADRERALAMHLGVTGKLLWAGKAVGLRITLATAKPAAVRKLIDQAWRARAVKDLLAERP